MPSEFIKRQKSDLIRDITSLGSLIDYILFLVVLLALGNFYLLKRAFLGLILIYIVIIIIRTFYFKERPEKLSHKSYIESLDASSFPSLHSARISFLSAILMKYYNNLYFSALAALVVLAVCYSRIQLKKHDFADAIFGILLGVLAYFIISGFF